MTDSKRFSLILSIFAMAPLLLGLLLIALLTAPPPSLPLLAGAEQRENVATPGKGPGIMVR